MNMFENLLSSNRSGFQPAAVPGRVRYLDDSSYSVYACVLVLFPTVRHIMVISDPCYERHKIVRSLPPVAPDQQRSLDCFHVHVLGHRNMYHERCRQVVRGDVRFVRLF